MAQQRDRRALFRSLTALVAVIVLIGAGYLVWALVNGPQKDDTDQVEDPLAGIDFGNYKALVIGNDDYAYLPDLETATRDARDVAHVLEERYAFEVTVLLNAEREELIDALTKLTREAEPTDNLLVYYAGHGSLTGPSTTRGSWWPVDAQPMEDTNWVHTVYEVTPLLEGSLARHILVIADSCYSAALATDPLAIQIEGEGTQAPLSREHVLASLKQPSRLVLASGGLSPVADSAGDGHSIFSGVLLQILQTNDSLLPVDALYERLTPRVVEASDRLRARQEPQLGDVEGTSRTGRQFFFVIRRDEETVATP